MTFTPLLITTICYLITAAGFYREGNMGLLSLSSATALRILASSTSV
jgi:hypothetical protein